MKRKRTVSILLCLLLIVTSIAATAALQNQETEVSPGTAVGEEESTGLHSTGEDAGYFLLGDVNFDGSVGVLDVLLIQKDKVMLLTLTKEQRRSADIDGNGMLAILDVLHIQKFLAGMYVEYPVGQWIDDEGNFPTVPTQEKTDPATAPETDPATVPTDTTTAPPTGLTEPTGTEPAAPTNIPTDPLPPTQPVVPEPTKPTDPTEPPSIGREEMSYVYLRDETGTLSNNEGKLWVYIPELRHGVEMKAMRDGVSYRAEISRNWDTLAFYRTASSVSKLVDPEKLPADELWNAWSGLPLRGQSDCFVVTGTKEGGWTAYDPTGERTIYFDAGSGGWQDAYVYGWLFGLDRKFVPMEYVKDGVYKLILPQAPAPGSKGFVFLNQNFWDGAFLTEDCVMEAGKNFYTGVRKAGELWTGTWDVYPADVHET